MLLVIFENFFLISLLSLQNHICQNQWDRKIDKKNEVPRAVCESVVWEIDVFWIQEWK